MVIYLFNRETYSHGLKDDEVLSLYKWNEQMCNAEHVRYMGESDDDYLSGEVLRLDMEDAESRIAFETDFNEENSTLAQRFIIRIFP